MIPLAERRSYQRRDDLVLIERVVQLQERQRRAFELTCQLIDNGVRTCDLAIHSGRVNWARRCEMNSRRLYAKIALVWAWNLPDEYREKLHCQSDRLKLVVRRLQEFQQSKNAGKVTPRGVPVQRFAPSRSPAKEGRVIEFLQDGKPKRQRKSENER